MKILFLSSEVVPLSKTGGLADVSGALPQSLQTLGCDVRVFTPLYPAGKTYLSGRAKTNTHNLSLSVGRGPVQGRVFQVLLRKNGVPIYLLDCDRYYDRPGLYSDAAGDFTDNAERFIFFCKAALESCLLTGFKPDIIHCNDWQCGLVPAYLRHLYQDRPSFKKSACLFTIHNLAYQGNFKQDKFLLTGLPESLYHMEGLEFWNTMSMLKAGLVYSDAISTVSPAYSHEIQTEAYGCGMEGVLAARRRHLYGILNGADYGEWDPSRDAHIAARYSSKSLWRKRKCKLDLLSACGLSESRAEAPLIGMISRLTGQKGFDLLKPVVDELMGRDLTLVLLGTGEARYHRFFKKLHRKYPQQFYVKLAYDNQMAHKIEAGGDLFLMPSRYEPCGLNQIYSLKYGTAPIVRATGGLDDTIEEYDPRTGLGNGFKFEAYSGSALLKAVERGLDLFSQKKQWRQLVSNAMQCDFSWKRSAGEYLRLYRKLSKQKQLTR